MKINLVLMLVMLGATAQASDSWDTCVSSDGTIVVENGQIVSPEENEEENYVLGSLIKKITIKTRKETCTLENSKYEVVSLSDETTFEVYNMNIGETDFTQDFICTRGGSGIPANDSCNEATTKFTETYNVK